MKKFWRDALIRAFRTFCQVLVTLIGGDYVKIVDLDWLGMIEISLTAFVVSILTAVATGLPETELSMILEANDEQGDE